MKDYIYGSDTIVLGGSTDDDTITISGLDLEDDYTLPTSLTGAYGSASLGTATSITSGGGAVGATLSTTLTNGLMWNNNTTYGATASPYVNATTGAWTTYQQPQVLRVSGDAEFDGDIKIKGVNLTDRLDAIEERLGILRPNNDLEGKWEKLKALGEEYRRLEKEILEGESIWDMLKK